MLLKLTEKRKLHTLISTRSLIAVLLLVISSCAKELPVQESDDIKDTVFKISLFDKEMKVEVMVNYGEGMQSLQPNLFSKVIGAEVDKNTGATNLELENDQTVDASSVLRFRM